MTDDDFASFFAEAWPRMFRTAFAISGDRGHAEDATQTAFAKVYASWSRVLRAEHPEAYVRRIVVNEVLGIRRRGWWRREQVRGDVLPMAFLSGSFFPLDAAPAWLRTVSDLLPLKHLNEGMLDVMVRGEGPAAALLPIAILAGFAVIVTLLAARLFRWETT